MATLHENKNPLKGKVRNRLFLTFFLFLLPTGLIFTFTYLGKWFQLYQSNQLTILAVIIIVSVFLGRLTYSHLKILQSGLKGEKAALKIVKGLPDSYHVFSSIKILQGTSEREIDLIIVGKEGLFIVEVKNYRGNITGNIDGSKWTQTKTSKKNERYNNPIANPIRQIKSQRDYVLRYLKRRGVNIEPQLMVLFPNRNCQVSVYSEKIALIQNYNQLRTTLNNSHKVLSNHEIRKIVKELNHLVN